MTDYDFHSLSPVDFERLVCDLLGKDLGVELKAFGQGPDGGVDLEASCENGVMVVQCKHYRGSSFADLKKAAKAEKPKMDRQAPDSYFFVTSQTLSRTQQQTIVELLSPHLAGVNQIYTAVELNELLRRFPDVEVDHFKLWMASASVLQRIVHSGIWQRSEALMEEIQDRVRLYVATPSMQRARGMLDEKAVCVITGAPGVGKSMLADMLALAHWHDGWQVVELASHEINRAWDVLNPDAKQFLYFDDAFGQTDVHERLSNDVGVTVSKLINYVGRKANKRLVITTRTHVLHEAEARDEPIARAGLHARACVVEVADYTALHRARILYNHLYFGDLRRSTVREFVNSGMHMRIIKHPNFTPRLIALSLQQMPDEREAAALFGRMCHTLDHPIELWGTSFREALSEPARMILLHLATFPAYGARHGELQATAMRSATPIEYSRAIRQLEGSWITINEKAPGAGVYTTIANPSCRDFILSFIDSQPEYVADIIGHATDIEQIARLLGYALTRTMTQEPKYPALGRAVSEHAAVTAVAIRAVGDAQKSAGGGMAASVLSSLMDSSAAFGLEIESWIIDQVLTLSAQPEAAAWIESRAACDLVRTIVDVNRIPASATEVSSCKLLILAWCEEVHAPDEWDEIFAFSSWLEDVASLSWATGEAEQIDRAFDQWVDSELDVILDNAKYLDEAEAWGRDVRRVNIEYYGSSKLSERFAQFDVDVEQRFGDPYPLFDEPPDRDNVWGSMSATPADSGIAKLIERLDNSGGKPDSARQGEAAQISAMFTHFR